VLVPDYNFIEYLWLLLSNIADWKIVDSKVLSFSEHVEMFSYLM
jgi:hypothetical protein